MNTPSWAKWFYRIFGSKLQGWYDFLYNMKLDPKTEALLDKIWNELEPQIQNAILTLVMALVAKYGQDKGESVFKSIMSKISPIKL